MNYEHASPIPVAEASVDVRANFIMRSYGHLLGGIFAFAALVTVFIKNGLGPKMIDAIATAPGGWLLFLGGFMVAGWIGSRMAAQARTMPAQYAGFGIVILFEALLFTPLLYVAATHFDGVIFKAGVATMVGFSALTAVAFVTRKDFSFLGGILKWGMICALGLIVASVIVGFNLGLLFSVAMVALAGAAILYDTSNVLHAYPEDRYVSAALALFTSVALMFWYVLQIFMSFDD